MNLLLLTQDEWLPLLIFGLGLLVAVAIVFGLKQSDKNARKMLSKREPKSLSLKINKQFITKKELVFLNAIHKCLPAEFIAFPKVPLAALFLPTSDKVSYNLISNKIADVCVFNKETMEPILVVDLVESEISSSAFSEMNAIAKKALKTVKIPLLEIKVEDNYDLIALRKSLITAMPDSIVTMLKQNLAK